MGKGKEVVSLPPQFFEHYAIIIMPDRVPAPPVKKQNHMVTDVSFLEETFASKPEYYEAAYE